ncbi:SAM-dependent methyltransferase [Halalkalibacillus sediminis]|uniref:Uncharacterized methyltransferase CEY16_10915 n=1 Tax=Halalkalibacillus sediminis TaxID=2018042 RepID=A0A2I0QSD0_9BACI|nr:class I SAM-dependent methyltransferase [Halalkalibacillus sediminis]PKR77241.1 SAM-dependent methyltransferase [Halalkalibacillus sediminis]
MGREFLNIFDEWADSYDDAVYGKDDQYRKVFEHYDQILHTVANKTRGRTVEFGIGTGNLTFVLLKQGVDVIGVEPNDKMRHIAQNRFPELSILNGDFLTNSITGPIDTITSTYAFHHLTDGEKLQALKQYHPLLSEDGQIVFADTIFEDQSTFEKMIIGAKNEGYNDLAEDLQREYYTTIPKMATLFDQAGYSVSFERLNDFVWLIHAKRK